MEQVRLSERDQLLRQLTIDVYFSNYLTGWDEAEIELDLFLDKLSEFIEGNKPACLDVRY